MAVSYIVLLSVVLGLSIDQVNTIRCTKRCDFSDTPFGSSDPFPVPCESVIVNSSTVCTVSLTINFGDKSISGFLEANPRLVDKPYTLDTEVSFSQGRTTGLVDYTCGTTDDCDQDFVRETVSSPKWAQLQESDVRADISSLLFNSESPTTNLLCANNVECPTQDKCYTQLTQKSSASQPNTTDFAISDKCDNTISPEVHFERQFNTPSDDQVMKMIVRCNKDNCNQQTTVEEVYNIIQNRFTFPLNYSSVIPYTNGSTDPTASYNTTGSPDTNGSYRTNDTIDISLIFFFIFIFLTNL